MPEQTQTKSVLEGEYGEPETAVAIREEPAPLGLLRDPDIVLAEARKAATTLTQVINSKPRKVVLNGERYLEVEDWTLLGQFYGVAPKTAWTRPVTIETAAGKARGWEAHVEVIDLRSGAVVGAGEAMCTDDEENWGARPKYGWMARPDADRAGYKIVASGKDRGWVRALVGEEQVSDGSRRSMAQTRATSRALAMRLRWIPVLAGFRGTPAEEMPQYRREAEEAAAPPENAPSAPVSDADRTLIRDAYRFFEAASADKGAKADTKRMAKHVVEQFKALMTARGWTIWGQLWAHGGDPATLAQMLTILGLERPAASAKELGDDPLR